MKCKNITRKQLVILETTSQSEPCSYNKDTIKAPNLTHGGLAYKYVCEKTNSPKSHWVFNFESLGTVE